MSQRKVSYTILLIVLFGSLNAQGSIIGYIVDKNGSPLIGATVEVIANDGTWIEGVCTDAFGEFSIKAKDFDYVLIKFIGFKTRRIEHKTLERDNWVLLEEEGYLLPAIVVTAEGRHRNCHPIYCGISTEETVVNTKGLNFESFSVYPNPTTDVVFINFNKEVEGRIEIFDLTGRRVATQLIDVNNSKTQMDITSYPAGSYLLHCNIKGLNYELGRVIKTD